MFSFIIIQYTESDAQIRRRFWLLDDIKGQNCCGMRPEFRYKQPYFLHILIKFYLEFLLHLEFLVHINKVALFNDVRSFISEI